jgi:16S rRNA (cytosine1402-N4)-methyltransferase
VVIAVPRQSLESGTPESGHIPVLLDETLTSLAIRPGGRYIDATFGGGGHSRQILEQSAPDGRILALDADPAAIERAAALSGEYGDRLTVVHSNFSQLGDVAMANGFDRVNGILFDLGLSSFQFDERERGFSMHSETRLDMRLDTSSEGLTAWDIVNQWSPDDVANVLFEYGDERRSRRIARVIADRREQRPIETNLELAEIIQTAVGGRKGARIHPATKSFQAIRIAVNQELDALRVALDSSIHLLAPGGRLAVIAFHSLEDRIVKQFFQLESRDCVCPPHLPVCNCDHKSTISLVTRRPIMASDQEQRVNPRSRSARLRVAERKL